ncbi:glycerol uptake facilitator protein [Mycobacterium frederiksbergense]|uniref:Glycerol uptake facilitator protein n=1 Tax=Mycolicibacterium frederiksbergense TaxID=117567 RepID=A0ABT6KZC2_9MYCO|nr:MIP/aquaporin family protein [Mycolicibacterium frederiksbergense]MDH6196047.1 glycerol uptake facilitator protein [Mycolicibacterium frederiksbergense]
MRPKPAPPPCEAEGPSWRAAYIGEALGTYLILLLGCSGVAVALLYGQVVDLIAMGIVWGSAVAVAVWATVALSGAHLNPAVTLAFALAGKHPWRQVVPFFLSQILGAFLGAATVMLFFGAAIGKWMQHEGISAGAPGSERAAMILVPFSPNPAIVGFGEDAYDAVPVWRGFAVEFVVTALLILVVLIVTHQRTSNNLPAWALPISIGAFILMATVVAGALTMTSLNPARDLGPRLVLALMDYESIAFPGPRGGLSMLITVAAPVLGGLFMGVAYRAVIGPALDHLREPAPVSGREDLSEIVLLQPQQP